MMKKAIVALVTSFFCFLLWTTNSRAVDIGVFCWNLAPFPDNIQVAITTQGNNYGLHGVLRNPTNMPGFFMPGPYSFAIDGSAVPDPVHGDIDIQFSWNDQLDPAPYPAGFGTVGFFHGKLVPGALVGPWQSFEMPTGIITGGTINPIPCPIP